MNSNSQQSSPLYAPNGTPDSHPGSSIHFLNLKSNDSKEGVDLKRVWEVVRRRKVFVGMVAGLLFAATLAWSVSRKPVYLSTFRLLIEPTKTTNVQAAQQAMLPNQLAPGINYTTLMQVLRSSEILLPIYQSLQKEQPTLTFKEFLDGLSVNRIKDTEIIEVSYLDRSATNGLKTSEQLANGYLRYGEQLRSRNLQQGIAFVEKQLPGLLDRVNQLQGKLEAFRQQNRLVNPEDRAKEMNVLIAQIQSEQTGVQAKLAESKALYAQLRQQVRLTPQAAIAASALSESKLFQSLREQLQQVETQISINSQRLTPDSPPIQALLKRREGIVAQLQREAAQTLQPTGLDRAQGNLSGTLIDLNRQLVAVSNEIQGLEAKNQTLIATAQQLQADFTAIPTLVRQDVDLQRGLKLANDSLDRFLASRESLQIEAAQNTKPWQIIAAPAQFPAPVFPSIPQSIGLGLVGSVFLSVLAALFVEKLDDVLYSADELKNGVKCPLLSVIPFYRNVADLSLPAIASLKTVSGALPPGETAAPAQTIAIDLGEDAAIFREAFRSLYLNVSVLNLNQAIQSVVVTSALTSDGKSTVALNMALAAATMGQRVLIVDADLYRSRTHLYARVENEQGLSQCLTSDASVHRMIQQSPLEQNLFVLSAGKAQMDAGRLLSSPKMKEIMDEVKDDYDLVVYDAPPLLGFSDSLILSNYTDGSVVVVGLGNTGRTALVESLRSLQLSGGTVLGIVANCLKPGTHVAHKYHEYVRRNYNSDLAEAT